MQATAVGQGNEECQDGYRVLRGISPPVVVTVVFTSIIINYSLIPYSISFFIIYEHNILLTSYQTLEIDIRYARHKKDVHTSNWG